MQYLQSALSTSLLVCLGIELDKDDDEVGDDRSD